MSSQKKVDLKVVLLGDSGVGKTCLLVRFLHGSFGDTTTTIGASFATKSILYNGRNYALGLWDTAGQERYDSLSSFYCRGSGCAIITFDLTNARSFKNVEKWVNKLNSSAPDKDCFIILVGTKLDVVKSDGSQRQVRPDEANRIKEKIGAIEYIETSAKDGENVNSVFDTIVQHMALIFSGDKAEDQSKVDMSKRVSKQNTGCCG